VEVSDICLSSGDILYNRYVILALLGKGGMGRVYLAKDLRLEGKLWAIKESKIPVDVQQFMDEAKMLAALEHPHLPKIADYFPPSQEGYSYLVMDYIKGHTLEDIFEERGRNISYPSVVRYSIQLCDVLHYLHHQPNPVIYRDLKPSNVMIDDQDNVRLIDFGIARNYKEGQQLDTVPLGTIGFAAPEQFKKQQTDHRVDIYSLGAMIYYLLSKGEYYYSGQKPLEEIRSELSSEFIQIVNRMMMENPKERYQSTIEIKRDFEHLGSDTTVVLTSLSEEEVSSHTPHHATSETLSFKSKFVAIGSLYPRTGSSLIAGNLADYFSQNHIPTSLVESPASNYWFEYFNGEIRNPHAKRKPWARRSGLHLVTHDHLIPEEQWDKEKAYKFLMTIKQMPIVIYDVSHTWGNVTNRVILEYADEIWVVLDFDIPHINVHVHILENLKERYGTKLKLILNKVTDEKMSKRFKKELGSVDGEFPLVVELARAAQWENRLITEDTKRLHLIEHSVMNLATKIVNKNLLIANVPWYKRISKKKRIKS
jgi:serine/threonine protein kinase